MTFAPPMTARPDNRRVLLATPFGIENRGIRYIAATLRKRGFEPHLVLLKRWVNNDLQPPTAAEEDLFIVSCKYDTVTKRRHWDTWREME